MKRFLLFFGEIYYPSGGACDFLADFNSKEEAIEAGREKLKMNKHTWCNVLDLETGRVSAFLDNFRGEIDLNDEASNDYTRED